MLTYAKPDTSAPASALDDIPQTPRGVARIDKALLHEPAEWACFPSAWHLAAWRNLASPSVAPCIDCLPRYRDAMAACGRCRHPDAVFTEEDGEIVGRVPTRSGASRFGVRDERDPESSVFTMVLACRVLGAEAVSVLVDIAKSALPHYRNGSRTLPEPKLQTLKQALKGGTRLLIG